MGTKGVLSGSGFAYLTLGIVSSACLGDGGDSFSEAFTLPSGVLSVADFLTPADVIGSPSEADTYLCGWDGQAYSLCDDDGSPEGIGNASAIFNAPVFNGSIDFLMTGFPDFGLTGDHPESGPIGATITARDPNGSFEAVYRETLVLTPNELTPYQATPGDLLDSYVYDVVLDNTITTLAPGDVDFFRFTGLPAGADFVAEVVRAGSPGFLITDPILGWYDDTGTQIATDDNSAGGLLPSLSGLVPSTGDVVLAVSGAADSDFFGDHTEEGEYLLQVQLPGGPLPGDYDGDFDIDSDDYAVWEATYAAGGVALGADGNGDGVVNAADYTIWRDALDASPSTIPEPAAGVLVLLLTASATGWHRSQA